MSSVQRVPERTKCCAPSYEPAEKKEGAMKRNSALKIGGKVEPEPMVGIFWLYKGELIFDVTPVSAAEPYGDCVGHANSHIEFWTDLQRAGVIPLDVEYEEPPRGRVVHH